MTYFAIQHKPTGGFLPAGKAKGHTWSEPTKDSPPRLFSTRRGAQQALNWWLDGGVSVHRGETYVDLIETPMPERDADDMQIVHVELTVRSEG